MTAPAVSAVTVDPEDAATGLSRDALDEERVPGGPRTPLPSRSTQRPTSTAGHDAGERDDHLAQCGQPVTRADEAASGVAVGEPARRPAG